MTEPVEKMAFTAEVGKVLHLMIHSLYTNRDIFLRELISNASDACDKLRYEAQTRPELLKKDAELRISITFDTEKKTVAIADNGIGMSREELIAHLGTIAKSGTQEFFSALTGDSKKDLPLIGQFGVGFYSSFMVADRVEVESRRADAAQAYAWSSDGQGEYTVTPSAFAERGTRITLHLKKGEEKYLDKHKLRHIVETYSDHISFPIYLADEEGKSECINSASALWTRPKVDIAPEQYKEFYHHVAHSPDEPWIILHNKAEGKIEYTNLLFIPSLRPFDLFHPERKRRVKLYVKRVFIADEGVDLVPQYLRFLRGVIDSEDLPLNISRETLQHNPLLDKIRDSITKRVLGELKKKAEKEPEEYAKFWNNFGAALKEGLCEAISPKEQILEVCRFHSTASASLTGLDDCIARMKEGQEHIYYLTGERLESVQQSPQLEGFKKRGVEVLLFTDHVDDFWVNVVQEYKGKKFKSITRAGIELDKLSEDRTEEKEQKAPLGDVSVLIAFLKKTYGDQVRDVRVTGKLSDSPVCLSVAEGMMDIRLERFLVEQKQLPGITAKILEINPDHPIIKALAAKSGDAATAGEVEDAAWLLLDQARIVEGEEITDPATFSRRLSALLQKGLAA